MPLIADEPLYRLPVSGDFILLSMVFSLTTFKADSTLRLPPRVSVGVGSTCRTILCGTEEEACQVRDQIAADHEAWRLR